MADDREALRDWHRLFGLLLTDFFTGSPFTVEVERDLSQQQQLLDVVILRRGRGRFAGRLPDGLDGLAAHNLITFKSHHEALDAWAMKELVGHYVAYRKLVSPSPSELLPEDRFRLYAVCARFPHNLSGRCRGRSGSRGCMIAGGARTWCASSWRGSCRARRTTRRCTCSARRRNWWASAKAPTGGVPKTRARCWDNSWRSFRGRVLPCRIRWKISGASTSRNTSPKLTPEEQRQALEALPPEKRREILAVAAAGGAPGGPVRRANPAVPGPADERPSRRAAQAAAEEVTGRPHAPPRA